MTKKMKLKMKMKVRMEVKVMMMTKMKMTKLNMTKLNTTYTKNTNHPPLHHPVVRTQNRVSMKLWTSPRLTGAGIVSLKQRKDAGIVDIILF